MAPLIRDLAVQVGDTAQEPDAVRTGAVLGAHADIWLRICAMASGQSVEWIGSLCGHRGPCAAIGGLASQHGFFYPPPGGPGTGPGGGGDRIALSRVLEQLAADGHGDIRSLPATLTWRQIMLIWQAGQSRRIEMPGHSLVRGLMQ